MGLMKAHGIFHALAIRGKGFLFKVGLNRYETFNDLKAAPIEAELICSNEFNAIKKMAWRIVNNSKINGIMADMWCWEDNGLYIACVEGDFVERPISGRYSIINGRDLREEEDEEEDCTDGPKVED